MDSTNTNWSKTSRYIAGITLALFGLFILYLSRSIIPWLIVAGLIALIVRPGIRWLHDRVHLPRGLAVALVYLLLIILLPLMVILIIPAIQDAVQFLQGLDYSALLHNSLSWLRNTALALKTLPVPIDGLKQYLNQTADTLLTWLDATPIATPQPTSISSFLQTLASTLSATVRTAAEVVGAVASNIAALLFTLLASIYLSLSAHTFQPALLRATPERFRPEMAMLIKQIVRVWEAFFRGQLTLMVFIGVICGLGLEILGVPGAFYLGVIAGLLEIIPNIGPVLATIPAVITALLLGSTHLPLSNFSVAVTVVVFYILVQQFENNLIVPKVLGEAVDLPPLVVLIGVWVGAKVGGVLGVFLATPMIATGRDLVRYVYRKVLGENPFPPEEQTPDTQAAPPWKKFDWMGKLSKYWNRLSAKKNQPTDRQTE